MMMNGFEEAKRMREEIQGEWREESKSRKSVRDYSRLHVTDRLSSLKIINRGSVFW